MGMGPFADRNLNSCLCPTPSGLHDDPSQFVYSSLNREYLGITNCVNFTDDLNHKLFGRDIFLFVAAAVSTSKIPNCYRSV